MNSKNLLSINNSKGLTLGGMSFRNDSNGLTIATEYEPFLPKVGTFLPEIKEVIFQKHYTIVVWADKESTIVKCSEEDFDKEKGLAMAIVKRYIKRNEFKRLIENANNQDK